MTMKFAFLVPPRAGHVNPTVGLGAELIQRGHEVAWISLDETLENLLPAGGRLLLVREEGGEGHRDKISQKNVYGVESIRFLYDDVLIPLNRHMSAGGGELAGRFRPAVTRQEHPRVAGAHVGRTNG